MENFEVIRPIGLNAICKEVERTCKNANIYKWSGLRPKHFVIPLDPGSGRTTLTRFIAESYKKARVFNFSSGIDDYIEIAFDGTLLQLKQAFETIDSAGVYANDYSGIVSMDIYKLSSHLGEKQSTCFIDYCKQLCNHATVIFFVHAAPDKNEETLVRKICENINNIKRFTAEPYTRDDICALIIKTLTQYGIEINNVDLFKERLSTFVTEFQISSVKGAIDTANMIISFAVFSDSKPIVGEESIKTMVLNAMVTNWYDDEKGVKNNEQK